jgi:hypothetical protein
VVSRAGSRWGTWSSDRDLLSFDPVAELQKVRDVSPIALVCTHGRHDVCCALEGRPVATALAGHRGFDVWECSHLGGDRFAANVLWLPTGWMLGGLTSSNAAPVLEAALTGRVSLAQFRGRCGDTAVSQAAQYFLMAHLGEHRPAAVIVEPAAHDQLTLIAKHEGERYRIVLEPAWTEPHHLTCRAFTNSRMRTYRLVGQPARL